MSAGAICVREQKDSPDILAFRPRASPCFPPLPFSATRHRKWTTAPGEFWSPLRKNDLSFSLFLSKIWPTMAAVNGRGLRVTSCFALHRFKAGNGLSVRRGCPSMFLCSSRLDEDWTRLLSTCQIFFGGPKSRENASETNVCGREWSVDKKENVKNCVSSFLIIGYVILQIHYFIFRRKSQVTK